MPTVCPDFLSGVRLLTFKVSIQDRGLANALAAAFKKCLILGDRYEIDYQDRKKKYQFTSKLDAELEKNRIGK